VRHVSGLWLGLVVLSTGCPRHPPAPTWGGTDAVRTWAKAPAVVEYVRVNMADEMALPDKPLRAEWNGPAVVDGRLLYDVITYDITEQPIVVEAVRHFYGPEGFGYLGTLLEDGTLEAWDPPQVVLPPDPHVGQTWAATHLQGERSSDRSCEISDSDLCDGGLVSVCDSVLPEGRIVLRDHFCPEVGWAGFEALVLRDGVPTVRMWSTQVVVDGTALPDPG